MGYTLLAVAILLFSLLTGALAALIVFYAIRVSQWVESRRGVAVSTSRANDEDVMLFTVLACVTNFGITLLFSILRFTGESPVSIPTLVGASMLFWTVLSAGVILLKVIFTAVYSSL